MAKCERDLRFEVSVQICGLFAFFITHSKEKTGYIQKIMYKGQLLLQGIFSSYILNDWKDTNNRHV